MKLDIKNKKLENPISNIWDSKITISPYTLFKAIIQYLFITTVR